jgi:hypothetical protein
LSRSWLQTAALAALTGLRKGAARLENSQRGFF